MIAQLLEFVLPIEGGQIVLVRTIEPPGEVVGVEADAVFGHFFDDFVVGFVLVEELIEEHTQMTRELGDFAPRTAAAPLLIFEFRISIFDWEGECFLR